jgi:putative ABC transport system permease protein
VKLYGLDSDTAPESYDPFDQLPFPYVTFVVRADAATLATLGAPLRRELHAVDPDQPVTRIEVVDHLVADSMARQRFAMTLFGVFSGLALLLAASGIYGVMAYAVAQRTTEFGIRLALGAERADILRLVLGNAAQLIALGTMGGVAGALAAGRLIQSLLFKTPAHDPLVFASVALLLAGVALVACLVPALRATRVNPMNALRSE